VGNWSEDLDTTQGKVKDYMSKKDYNSLTLTATQQKFAKALQRAPHTYNEDGNMRFGDHVLLQSNQTKGWLVTNIWDEITTSDEAYAVTACMQDIGPVARSVLIIEKGNLKDGAPDDLVCYGQDIRLRTTTQCKGKELFLHSSPLTPSVYARFSRNQEVSVISKAIYNTVWRIQPLTGARESIKGTPVKHTDAVMLEHVATNHFLSNDFIDYQNGFGKETEVSVFSKATKHKTQMLENEYKGNTVRENVHKAVASQNSWSFVYASDPSAAEPIVEAKVPSGAELMQMIKETLTKRGSMEIRSLGMIFRSLDDNRNRKVDKFELQNGLIDFGIHLSDAEATVLFGYFDRDQNGQIVFDEFLRCLRGDLSEARLGWIKKAYGKLDANSDGKVTLEDVARLYDASHHPDVVERGAPVEEVYKKFMSQWDT